MAPGSAARGAPMTRFVALVLGVVLQQGGLERG
jgi:hypothetical protein